MKYYLSVLLGVVIGMVFGISPANRQLVARVSPPTIGQKMEEKKVTTHPLVIDSIQPPSGYTMVREKNNGFGLWLLHLPLKKDNVLYLYNGSPKPNQTLHFAVLDVPYNRNPLQQCADAIMRLRAEYLYATKADSVISFYHQQHQYFTCATRCSRAHLEAFLNNVFSWCGTYSLQAQLHPVANRLSIKAGDVLVKGGSPGHAMLVAAVAQNKQGKKVFLLLQSFIPAQDIHLVINPFNTALSPWYDVEAQAIATPGWTFSMADLRSW